MASWGGYSFIINLLPIHCLACVVTGRLTPKLYIAYAPFVVLGTITAGAGLINLHHCPVLCGTLRGDWPPPGQASHPLTHPS